MLTIHVRITIKLTFLRSPLKMNYFYLHFSACIVSLQNTEHVSDRQTTIVSYM